MSTTTAIAVYFLVWWLTLFAVLPWGVRAQGEGAPEGTDPGAPAVPHLKAKLLWTTIVSGVIFGVCSYLYVKRIVTFDDLSGWIRL